MSGWIKLYRSIQSHWLWESEKPFDKRSAWIDILLLANHDDNKAFFDNEIVFVKRGEHITSEPKLAERWGWSRTKVRNFLNLLEKDGMIENKKEGRKRTRLIVLNYNDYQGLENNEKTNNDTTVGQEEDRTKTREEQEENINKNEKNEKNEKNVYKDIVEYLNEKCNKNYKYTTKSTKTKIDARLNEGFTLDDFKKVIDNKVATWTGTEWEKYLRPETLFGSKFEGYLNENKIKQQPTRFHNFKQRTDRYSADDLEAIAEKKRQEYYNKVQEHSEGV